jgi:hypothetical protein
MRDTQWERYGRASGNPKCQNCMVHCGYEPSAVDYTFSGVPGLWATVKAMVFNTYANPMQHLVQLGLAKDLEQRGAA